MIDLEQTIQSVVENAHRVAYITDKEIEKQTIKRWKDKYEREW